MAWRGKTIRGQLERAMRYGLRESVRRRLTSTDRLLHLMIVFVVPVLLAALTWLSNAVAVLPFVIYPPLAAGTFTLFADPESRYAEPKRFIGGMTLGAFSGWASLAVLTEFWYAVPPGQFEVHAGATALAVGLTAVLTWGLDLEVPTAFSTALLALLAGTDVSYVLAIAISSSLVAGVFVLWRDRIYDKRSQFLYRSTTNDDRVLVPIRDQETDEEAALFGAFLAAAHDAGSVVLFRASQHTDIPAPRLEPAVTNPGEKAEASTALDQDAEGQWTETPQIGRLQSARAAIEETVEVPVEVAISEGDPSDPSQAVEAAHALNCDLVVSSHEEQLSESTPYLAGLFRSDLDVIALHPSERTSSWSRVLVLVRGPGPSAQAMIDFATRIATGPGRVSVAHTVEGSERRREGETMLSELVDSVDPDIETRVATGSVGAFLERNAKYYDVVFVGSSTDRSVASRLLSPPTFQNLESIDADVALVHLG